MGEGEAQPSLAIQGSRQESWDPGHSGAQGRTCGQPWAGAGLGCECQRLGAGRCDWALTGGRGGCSRS